MSASENAGLTTFTNLSAPSPNPAVLLREAHGLAERVESLLQAALPECSSDFRVRLARAHVLGLLDQLAELIVAELAPESQVCTKGD